MESLYYNSFVSLFKKKANKKLNRKKKKKNWYNWVWNHPLLPLPLSGFGYVGLVKRTAKEVTVVCLIEPLHCYYWDVRKTFLQAGNIMRFGVVCLVLFFNYFNSTGYEVSFQVILSAFLYFPPLAWNEVYLLSSCLTTYFHLVSKSWAADGSRTLADERSDAWYKLCFCAESRWNMQHKLQNYEDTRASSPSFCGIHWGQHNYSGESELFVFTDLWPIHLTWGPYFLWYKKDGFNCQGRTGLDHWAGGLDMKTYWAVSSDWLRPVLAAVAVNSSGFP